MDLPQPSSAKAVSSRDFKQRNRRRRKRRTRKSGGAGATQPPPPSPTVLSLMEMGFPRNAVERAVKAMPNASPSPVRLSKNVSGKIGNVVLVKPFLSTLRKFHWAFLRLCCIFPLVQESIVGWLLEHGVMDDEGDEGGEDGEDLESSDFEAGGPGDTPTVLMS